MPDWPSCNDFLESRHVQHPPAMADQAQNSINIPQIIAVALVGFFAIRWFWTKPSSPSAPSTSSSSRNTRQVDVAKVDQVSSMFPQLDRRTIAWDLHRNGGNVAATTERVLAGRGLDAPPPTYQPNLPSPAAAAAAAAEGRGGGGSGKAARPDLITRYGLQSRVGGKGKEPVPSEEQKRSAWSSDKVARADGLKRRREEMILEARRKMEAKDQEA